MSVIKPLGIELGLGGRDVRGSELEVFPRRLAARGSAVRSMLAEMASTIKGKRPSRSWGLGDYRYSCFRTRYRDVTYGDSDFPIKLRLLRIAVAYQDRLAGAAELREWSVPPAADLDEFLYFADHESHSDLGMAEVVVAKWEPHEAPHLFGSIVLFDRLVVDSLADSGHSAVRHLGQFLPMEFGDRVAVMLLKSFPLEFEGKHGGTQSHEQDAFQRRKRAMQRHYQKAFGVQIFQPEDENPDWMWRTFDCCPEPTGGPSAD